MDTGIVDGETPVLGRPREATTTVAIAISFSEMPFAKPSATTVFVVVLVRF